MSKPNLSPDQHLSPTVYMMDLLATVPYYTAYLSRALLERGVAVSVGSISYYLDAGCFKSRGLRLDPGAINLVARFPGLPRKMRRIAKLLETAANHLALLLRFYRKPPSVLHVQYLPMLRSRLPMDWWLVRLLQHRGSRVVLTVHDLLPHDTANQFREKFERLYALADELICHSGHIRDRLHSEFSVEMPRIHVIPHGPFFFDLPGRASLDKGVSGIPPGTPIVLWQGILFPYKGLDLLLDAWQNVEARTDSAVLLVVGTGAADLLEGVRAQVRRLGLRRVVLDLRFTSTEELVAAYRAACVVVYPYRAITTSGALATGLSLEKAIVAADLPVFRELLTHDRDALLVPAGDTKALADSIFRLLTDHPLRLRFEAAVREKNFGAESWRAIARQTETVYQTALARELPTERKGL